MKMMLIYQIMILINLTVINLIFNILPSYNKMIHPIIMGLILLIMLINSSLNIEIYNYNNWISYLMYLIIIGGLMIIFLYFTSFVSNMKMNWKLNYIKIMPIKMMIMIIMLILIFNKLNINYSWYFNNNNEIMNLLNSFFLKINTMYMYIYNKNYSMIFCMIYLLIVLMFIVKICIYKKLSLRKIN